MLDEEPKNYKGKEALQHHHQTPVYKKQNQRSNPFSNDFPEKDNHFWQQRTLPESSKYSDPLRNG